MFIVLLHRCCTNKINRSKILLLIQPSYLTSYFTGSTKGGTDIAAYTNVGIVNHYTVHGLQLQDGHEYYATVRGIIYLNYFS